MGAVGKWSRALDVGSSVFNAMPAWVFRRPNKVFLTKKRHVGVQCDLFLWPEWYETSVKDNVVNMKCLSVFCGSAHSEDGIRTPP